MIKKGSILTIVLLLIASASFGQKNKGFKRAAAVNHEIGISLGVINYVGDLAWKGKIPIIQEINPAAFRPAGGFYYRNNFTKFTSFRISLMAGQIMGDDSKTNGDPARLNRNLHFRSIIVDAAAMLEWNMAPYKIGDKKRFLSPFLGVGIAGFYFNPQAKLNDRWVDLQPYGTEGQGIIEGTRKYSLMQFAIPISFGVKANITKKLALSLEYQYRYTFTDHLDDVSANSYISEDVFTNNYIPSIATEANALAYRAINPSASPRATDQRGNPNQKDAYFFVLLSLSYKIGKGGNNATACPTFR